MKNIFKRKPSDFPTEYTVSNAIKKGDFMTRLSMLIMGAGNIARKQIVKGILFFITELAYIFYMASYGIYSLTELPTLGHYEYREIETSWGYDYEIVGIPSVQVLLYGVVTIIITLLFIALWRETVKSAYKAQCLTKEGKHVNTFFDDIKDLFNVNLHKLLLALPIAGILTFTILPLIFMILQAFTNYSDEGPVSKLQKFEWVGFDSFKQVFAMGGDISEQFWSVRLWTIIWAIFATVLNYVLGMILAIVINRKGTRLKAMWRFNFVLSVAIPQFVSLLIVRSMFSETGTINNLLLDWGWIDKSLPFWSDPTWARITVIIINLWVGIPYTMLQITGILQNIPAELYEAAKVDGANAVTTFFKITLPYMLFVTMPYLITTFTGNVNNFNVIYLLTGGGPTPVGNTAGKTDLLVTWLYKLTIDENDYNIGAVIGIMTFVVLAIVSLVTYRSTGSYKNEEGFQ